MLHQQNLQPDTEQSTASIYTYHRMTIPSKPSPQTKSSNGTPSTLPYKLHGTRQNRKCTEVKGKTKPRKSPNEVLAGSIECREQDILDEVANLKEEGWNRLKKYEAIKIALGECQKQRDAVEKQNAEITQRNKELEQALSRARNDLEKHQRDYVEGKCRSWLEEASGRSTVLAAQTHSQSQSAPKPVHQRSNPRSSSTSSHRNVDVYVQNGGKNSLKRPTGDLSGSWQPVADCSSDSVRGEGSLDVVVGAVDGVIGIRENEGSKEIGFSNLESCVGHGIHSKTGNEGPIPVAESGDELLLVGRRAENAEKENVVLKERVTELQEQVSKFSNNGKDLTALQNEVDRLNGQVDALRMGNEEMKHALDSKDQHHKESDDSTIKAFEEKLRTVKKEWDGRISTLIEENGGLLMESANLRDQVSMLQEEKIALVEEVGRNKAMEHQYRSQSEESQKENEDLRRSLEEMRSQMNGLAREKSEIETALRKLQTQKPNRVQELEDRVSSLSTELERLESEKENVDAKKNELMTRLENTKSEGVSKVAECETRIRALELQVESSETEARSSNEEAKALKAKCRKLEGRMDQVVKHAKIELDRLKSEKESAVQENLRVTHRLTECMDRVQQLEAENSSLACQKDDTVCKLIQLENALNEKSTACADMQRVVDKIPILESQLQGARDSLQKSECERDKQLERIKKLECALGDKRRESESVKRKLKEADAALEEAQCSNRSLEQKCTKLKERVSSSSAANKTLGDRCCELEQNTERMKLEAETQASVLRERDNRISDLTDNLKHNEERLNGARDELAGAKKNGEELHTALQNERHKASDLNQQIRNKDEIIGNLNEEVEKVKAECAQVRGDLEAANDRLDDIQAKLDAREQECTSLQEELKRRQEEILELQGCKSDLHAPKPKVKALEQDREVGQARIQDLESAQSEREELMAEMCAQIKVLQEELTKASEANEGLRKAVGKSAAAQQSMEGRIAELTENVAVLEVELSNRRERKRRSDSYGFVHELVNNKEEHQAALCRIRRLAQGIGLNVEISSGGSTPLHLVQTVHSVLQALESKFKGATEFGEIDTMSQSSHSQPDHQRHCSSCTRAEISSVECNSRPTTNGGGACESELGALEEQCASGGVQHGKHTTSASLPPRPANKSTDHSKKGKRNLRRVSAGHTRSRHPQKLVILS